MRISDWSSDVCSSDLEVLCRRQIWADVENIHDISYGPMAKMFTTETMYTDASAIVEAAAPGSLVRGLDADMDIVETTMRRAIAMTVYGDRKSTRLNSSH